MPAPAVGYEYISWAITTQPGGANARIENGKLIIPANSYGAISLTATQVETKAFLNTGWKDLLAINKNNVKKVVFTKDSTLIPNVRGIEISDSTSNFGITGYVYNNEVLIYSEYDIYVLSLRNMFSEFVELEEVDLTNLKTSPSVIGLIPTMHLMVVVFPAPLWPINAKKLTEAILELINSECRLMI